MLIEEIISEGLTYKDPVEKWIRVFKDSKHSKFKDKSPAEREKMARAAQYRAVQNKKLGENFADGKNPGRKGLAKRSGVNCKQSVTKLRQVAKNSSGEKQRMAHWCANMKSGKKK